MRLPYRKGLALLALPAALAGSVTVAPAPTRSPDFATVQARLDQATLAIVHFADGSAAMVADADWLARLKRLLSDARGGSEPPCFCLNFPRVELATREGTIATAECVHGRSLRFSGKEVSGQFRVEADTVAKVGKLLDQQRGRAMPRPKAPKLPLPAPSKISIEIEPAGERKVP